MFLSGFECLRPEFEGSQLEVVQWLAAAHVQAQTHVIAASGEQRERFRQELMESLLSVSGWPDRIASRGSYLGDFTHYDWSAMEIYRLDESAKGRGMSARTAYYVDKCDALFEELFSADEAPPENLIHVTCTGYASPSAPQKLVVARGWHSRTRVTHAYHMGCHAAIPALRVGEGFLAAGAAAARVDIVHTELCSLHFDPSRHDMEQLVVQSLFSDGAARYSLTGQQPQGPALELLALREELLPGTAAGMTWVCGEHGMGMTLGREVPRHIEQTVAGFVDRLFADSPLRPADKWIASSHYAVHPGGPLILDVVAERMQLKPSQLRHSNQVLRTRGNMSSATLPHIWAEMLEDPDVDPELPVVSLAFGPGLTVCGAVFRLAGRALDGR